MSDPEIRVGTMPYDTTQALLDGSVTFEGVEASGETAGIASEIFRRMVRDRDFDAAELGLTVYARTLDFDDPPFVAIPAFPARIFRHSCIFVNTASGISRPEDLAGKTVGAFGMYGQDSGIWAKGILSDDYGVTPDQCRWVIGGLDQAMPPFDFIPQPHPAAVQVEQVPPGRSLSEMLEAGEIDALVSANVPQCVDCVVTIGELLRTQHFLILDLTGDDRFAGLAYRSAPVDIVTGVPTRLPDSLRSATTLIIRPDAYIAWVGDTRHDESDVKREISRWLEHAT